MKSIIEKTEFWTIIAVIVGFLLGELSRTIRDYFKILKLKKALNDEIQSNLYQIPQQKNIIEQVVDALKKQQFLSPSGVPFKTVIYDNYFALLSPKLSTIQKDNLHIIYGKLKKIDSFLEDFDSKFRKDLEIGVFNNIWEPYQIMLNDILKEYDVLIKIIKRYLDNNPVDVLHRHKSKDVSQIKIVRAVNPDDIK
ncbi:MAG: hypothetical protein ACTSPW_20440 [Promethearchaeota archaeon]